MCLAARVAPVLGHRGYAPWRPVNNGAFVPSGSCRAMRRGRSHRHARLSRPRDARPRTSQGGVVFGRRKREEEAAAEAAREAERHALFARLAERPEHICPFLGLADDRAGYVEGVSDDHRCYAFGDPAPLSAEQQTRVCQERGYGNCPRYLRGVLVIPTEELEALRQRRAPLPEPVPAPAVAAGARRRGSPILLLVAALVLLVGGAGAFLLFGDGSGTAVAPSPSSSAIPGVTT